MIKTKFEILELCCSAEENVIRKKLSVIPNIKDLNFDFISHTLSIEHSSDIKFLIKTLDSVGMSATVIINDNEKVETNEQSFWLNLNSIKIFIAVVLAISSEVIHFIIGGHNHSHSNEKISSSSEITSFFNIENLLILFAFVAIVLCGTNFAKKTWNSIKTFSLNIHILMFVAVIGAILLGEYSEAAMVISLFALAELIEKRSLLKVRNALGNAIDLSPNEVEVFHQNEWHKHKIHHVKTNDILRVRLGEKIMIDGEVISGTSTLNQAAITGESIPVVKSIGDNIFAGSINQEGTFDYKAKGTAENSTINNVKKLVNAAQFNKGVTERFIDKFSRIYTPIVFLIGLIIAFIFPLIFGGNWHEWLEKGLFILVTGCPCALVISTPVTIVSALTNLARNGIIVKGGAYIEEGSKINLIVFDKTGTLTEGSLKVTDVVSFSEYTENDILHVASAIEAKATHPIAKAVITAHENCHQSEGEIFVLDFKSIIGRGACGIVEGVEIYVGNHRLAHELNVCSIEIEDILYKLESDGKTIVLVMTKLKVLGIIGVTDSLRSDAIETVLKLKNLGIKTAIISGDNVVTTNKIGKQLGILDSTGDLLPEDKISKIVSYQKNNQTIGMVGDGINDAPAIAKADIGFALGSIGSGMALEAATVNIIDNNLNKIIDFILTSKKTLILLKQNLWLAIGIKFVFAILALFGYSFLWLAVFADMGASLIVTTNGLRMLKYNSKLNSK